MSRNQQFDDMRRNNPMRMGGPGGPGGPGRGGPRGLTMPVEKAQDFSGTLKRLLIFLRPYLWVFILVILLTGAGNLLNIVSPKIMGAITTELYDVFEARLNGQTDVVVNFDYIGQIILLLAALYLASAGFTYLMQYVLAGVSQKMAYDFRQKVNRKLSRLPLKYFDSNSHGEILSRVVNDVDNIAGTLQQTIVQAITSFVTFVGVLIMMLTISGWLTLVTLITIPMATFITTGIAKRSQRHFRDQQKSLGELNGHVEEMLTAHSVVKAFGCEKLSKDQFDKINEKLYESGWKAQYISGLIMPMMRFVNNLGYLLVAVIGGIFVTKQYIKVGDVQAFTQYVRRFSQPIINLATIANVIQSTIASAERVFQILDEEEIILDKDLHPKLTAAGGQVEFENVYFGYNLAESIFKGLSFTVKPGQLMAIVGPTGAGKTTLVNLLMRFYEIDSGQITIDGVNITDIPRSQLRSMFGMVLQDTWLFNGSIRENIAYGKSQATFEEVVEAAKAAYADQFIRMLPDGYDTVLNEESTNLSQGQKQLLTIARAILANPSILILDEATSSVDTRTELQIQKAMEKLMQGRTSFVIAHRLSTIREADHILVINEGQIVEQGKHTELLAANGFYADLYNSQFLGVSLGKTG
jgi:ATP-binding cassette subfamily B multidrug efflux pump